MTPQSYAPFDTLDKIRRLNAELLEESEWLARFEREGEAEAAAAHAATVQSLQRQIEKLEEKLRGTQK